MQYLKLKVIAAFYLLSIIGLFLYSYTQVDLGLTFIRHPLLNPIQRSFQYVGYFQRPLSTYIYLLIIIVLFISYLLFIIYSIKNKFPAELFWTITIIQSAVLLFSYNAFSYDLFNYIFDARILTYYHQNPYLHKALDYPGDPMLGFMHWTQRVFPYGPIWLIVSVIISVIGLQYFLLNFLLFKLLAVISFILTIYFIGKILEKFFPKDKLFGLILFAFNPLVVVESLVSSHLDIFSVCLTIISLYFFINKVYVRSFLLLLVAFGVKFISIFLSPVMLYAFFFKKNIQLNSRKFYWIILVFMAIPVALESIRTNFQPWYLVSLIPFASFLGRKTIVIIPLIIIPLFSLLEYVPFLWTGNWNPPIPTILNMLTCSGVIISLLLIFLIKSKNVLQL